MKKIKDIKVLIINPNSSEDMTKDIQRVAEAYADGEYTVKTVSTPGAPEFIDYYIDAAKAAPGMMKIIQDKYDEFDAFIVACHCDPNLDLLKEFCDKPVIGIGEASMKMASMLGHSFSVISTGSHSIANKEMLIHKYGLDNSAASVRAPETDVVSYNSADLFMSAAKAAVEKDAAEVLVLGCAGMAGIDKAISERFNVPVLDGIICAMMMAVGMVKAGYSTSKYRQYSGPEK